MIKIIPAILVEDKKEFLEKLRLIPRSVKWAQIDVMDGTLTRKKSFADPKLLQKFSRLNFEIHLMVKHPLRIIPAWTKTKHIIFHIESRDDPARVIDAIHKQNAEAVIAINPKTPMQKISPLLKWIDGVTVMAVTPGAQGRIFQKNALKKITELKKEYPGLPIEIDGGIGPTTIPRAIAAGANRFAAASAVFGQSDPNAALRGIIRLANPSKP